MLESNLIKQLIVKTFISNSWRSLPEIAQLVMRTLESKFFPKESVFVRSSGKEGKVRSREGSHYTVIIEDSKAEVHEFEALERRYRVTYDSVLNFLEYITVESVFGRILIENVTEKMQSPDFGRTRLNRYAINKTHEIKRDYRMQHDLRDDFRGVSFRSAEPFSPKELDVSTLEVLEIPGCTVIESKYVVKIYMFFYNFSDNLGIKSEDITLENVASVILDSDYSSELAFLMHVKIIKAIESEAKYRREKFYESIKFILQKFTPPDISSLTSASAKKRISPTIDTWKQYAKAFITAFSAYPGCESFERFEGFVKKGGECMLRLEFLATLIDIATYTETFRNAVAEKQSALKSEKMKFDQLLQCQKGKTDTSEYQTLKDNLKDYPWRAVNNPLKVHLGKYKGYPLVVIDKRIMLKDSDRFCILKKDDALAILHSLNFTAKRDKAVETALKKAVDALYST